MVKEKGEESKDPTPPEASSPFSSPPQQSRQPPAKKAECVKEADVTDSFP